MYLSCRVRSLLEYLFVKLRGFAINRTENYYRETAPFIALKIQMFKQSQSFFTIFQSGFF